MVLHQDWTCCLQFSLFSCVLFWYRVVSCPCLRPLGLSRSFIFHHDSLFLHLIVLSFRLQEVYFCSKDWVCPSRDCSKGWVCSKDWICSKGWEYQSYIYHGFILSRSKPGAIVWRLAPREHTRIFFSRILHFDVSASVFQKSGRWHAFRLSQEWESPET